MAYKLYSIESRKGGVGKTTIALNLASILVKRGPVLLLDCDITGTSIVEPARNSSFWDKDTNMITYTDKTGVTKDLNLIWYFLENFIKGDGNVRDFINPNNLMSSKVNVIGSFLYGSPQEAAINFSWLIDELHSYWMVELIGAIVKEFEGIYADRMVHVIIDNSPGYTSFNQALHNHMYEIGPQNSKFLLVSTLDSQDLQANIEAATEISNSIDNRVKAANYYKLKEDDEEDEIKNPNTEAIIESDGDIKDFFFHLIENKQLIETYTKGYNIDNYLALILNKIPQSLQDDETEVAYEKMMDKQMNLFLSIMGSKGGKPKNLVYYDEAIVYQFYLRYLHRRLNASSGEINYWTRRLREMRQQAAETATMSPVTAMTKLNNYYESLQLSLTQRGYAQLSRQLARTWAPSYACDIIKQSITTVAQRLNFETKAISPEKMKAMLHIWNHEQLYEIQTMLDVQSNEHVILKDLIDYLEVYAGRDDEKKRVSLMFIVSMFLYTFKNRFEQWDVQSKSLKDYAMSEYLRHARTRSMNEIWGEEIEINSELKFSKGDTMKLSKIEFAIVYRYFCYAFIRLIDQHVDFDFFLSAIRLYVPSAPPLSFSKEMTDYLSEVIYRKRLRHNENRLSEIRANSYVMKNMQDVLRDNILKAWK